MLSHEITSVAGSHKVRTRVGRGVGSGHGKTSGRGHKGQKSRSGYSSRGLYAGGQMPLFRKLPKVGFSNFQYEKKFEIVNIMQLDNLFEDGASINIESLVKAGLVANRNSKVKILGEGNLSKKFNVAAHKFSKSAQQKIAECGGSAELIA